MSRSNITKLLFRRHKIAFLIHIVSANMAIFAELATLLQCPQADSGHHCEPPATGCAKALFDGTMMSGIQIAVLTIQGLA